MVDTRHDSKYKQRIVNNENRTKMIIEAVLERVADGRVPGIVFVKEKLHAKIIAEVLNRHLAGAGRHPMAQVAHVTADVPKKKRQAMAQQMRDGTLQVVVATSVWATGLDIPNLRFVVWAGGGQAPCGFLQARGRGSRIDDGKTEFELIIIEDVGLPNHEAQGRKRLEHLHNAGMISNKEFYNALESAPQPEPDNERMNWGSIPLTVKLFHPCSPFAWLFYAGVGTLFIIICNIMESVK